MNTPNNLKRQAIERRGRARRLLLQTLYQWQISAATAESVYDNRLVDERLHDIDEAYFDAAYAYITEEHDALEVSYNPFMNRQAQFLDAIERAILWIAAYECEHCPDIHPNVSINEAIELAKKFGAEDSFKFINATLDKWHKSKQH